MRWKLYFDSLSQKLEGKTPEKIDFYAVEEPWAKATNPYSAEAEGDCIETAKRVMQAVEQYIAKFTTDYTDYLRNK